MPSPRRLAACLALLTACASRPEPPPEQGALGRLLDLPLERRDRELAAHVAGARPRLLVEVVPPATFEAELDDLLPIGLDDFDILRVVVEVDDPTLTLSPALALVVEDRPDIGALPMYAPTRALFAAFTRERPASSHTRYSLKSAGLPWWINLATVGIFEIATLELSGEEIEPDEEAQIRATPWAQRLAVVITPPHGCGGRSPCDRYYVVPRPRDELPLRLDLELELRDTAGVRVTWSAALPAGKPLAARLRDRFHGKPQPLAPIHVEPTFTRPRDPALCRLDQPVCAAPPTTARVDRTAPQPPAIAAPAELASPAQSLAARPTWSPAPNYAPATSLEHFTPADLVPGGPLRGNLLVCDFTVRGGPDPDTLVAELRVGATPAHRPDVFRHADRARIVVPLVQLDPGEAITFKVWSRTSSWFWGVQDVELGRSSLAYAGTLPLARAARGLDLSCVALTREALEREVAVRIAALADHLASFDLGVDPISESSLDWGIGAWGMTGLQRRVEAIAGLVGWSDPRVVALLPALTHYHAVFLRHLGRLIARKREQLPAPGTLLSFEKGDLRVIGSACGDSIDRKRILWARDRVPADGCVTILEVSARAPNSLETSPRTGSLGALWNYDLAWDDGRRSDAWTVGVEPPPGKRRDPERLILAPGESARFYLAPSVPIHRAGQGDPVLLHALDGLKPVFVRLR